MHEIWEAAAVSVQYIPGEPGYWSGVTVEREWFVGCMLNNADPEALEIGGYAERFNHDESYSKVDFISEFCEFVEGDVIAANNVAFDMSFLKAYAHQFHRPETWHYSAIDVKSYAAGALGWCLPLPKSSEIGTKLGVEKNMNAHHALADAHYARRLYETALIRNNR